MTDVSAPARHCSALKKCPLVSTSSLASRIKNEQWKTYLTEKERHKSIVALGSQCVIVLNGTINPRRKSSLPISLSIYPSESSDNSPHKLKALPTERPYITMALRRTSSCPEISQSATTTHPGCPLQDPVKTGFCPSCYARQRREFRDLQIDLEHLEELVEIIRKKHENEMRSVSESGKPMMVKRQQELMIEIDKWVDAKILELTANDTIKAKMLANLSLV